MAAPPAKPGRVKPIDAVPLDQLLASPLVALVRADVQAARATADFITEVGFLPAQGKEAQRLKTVRFAYEKEDADGTPATFFVEVPLLALVGVPSLSIRDAIIEFNIRVVDVVAGGRETGSEPLGVMINGALTDGGVESTNGSIHVRLQVGPTDMAAGVAKLLQVAGAAIREEGPRRGKTR
jgi:hypothetical protein